MLSKVCEVHHSYSASMLDYDLKPLLLLEETRALQSAGNRLVELATFISCHVKRTVQAKQVRRQAQEKRRKDLSVIRDPNLPLKVVSPRSGKY
ncbi:jg15284 [Pararge aegeria aegeria]|uniref:Jg15284 protein n=1 Tax=Pararge aegeria aegeria TaxID=348720 RepID=A0A8S4R4Z1_9NEOP|nr:jg15284 [Pararge aegeria aegeria]